MAASPAPLSVWEQVAAKLEGTQDPNDWRRVARPEQLPPDGDWHIWLIVAGRGYGKTRAGAETLAEWARTTKGTYAVVGPTFGDARAICVEGAGSGLIDVLRSHSIDHTYNRSLYEIKLGNGSLIVIVGADTPDRLRGYNLAGAWADEIASWRRPATWHEALIPALRIGHRPRAIVTGTPKPVPLVKELMARTDGSIVVTRGRTLDNAANLSQTALDELLARYQGTRLGRQELDGELLEDIEGALWTLLSIEESRVTAAPILTHKIVSVDPAGDGGDGHDEHGITVSGVTGRAASAEFYVLADLSRNCSPGQAARTAILAYVEEEADAIVYEKNQGQGWITAVLQATWAEMQAAGEVRGVFPPLRPVDAARSKRLRAEPVQALYEQGRVHHVGAFPALEDQMTSWVPGDADSPDRLDSCFVAGTLVLTSVGERPIEAVLAGESVWTRAGWRRVRASALTRTAAPVGEVLLSTGRRFQCTPEHRVLTGRGWVTADALVHGDTLSGWTSHRQPSLGTASPTAVTPRARNGATVSTTAPQEAPDTATCIAISTNPNMARSRRAGMSIMWIMTRSIMNMATCKLYHPRITLPCTRERQIGAVRSGWSIWLASGHWPPNGTAQSRAEHGMSRTAGKLGSTDGLLTRSVKSAATRIRAKCRSITALVSAWLDTIAATISTTRSAPVPSVEHATGERRAGAVPLPVPVSVARPYVSSGKAAVYNLEVEGLPEYVAEGVIVHNCVHGITYLYGQARFTAQSHRPPPRVPLPTGVGAALGGSGGRSGFGR